MCQNTNLLTTYQENKSQKYMRQINRLISA